LLGAVGREGDPELRHPGGGSVGQGGDDVGRAAGAVCAAAGDGGGLAGAASVAAGVDRRAGAALRLLPERHDDPGRRPSQHDEESDRGSDPDGDERPPLPLRAPPADPDRDQAGGGHDGEGRQVMTGFIQERELSRKTFLKGGGAMIVGFSVLGAFAGKARAGDSIDIAGDSPFASNAIDQNQVDAWLTLNADNTAWVKSGAIFQGAGSTTGVLMIAAEELDMDLSQLSLVQDDTDVTPNTGQKDASNTIVGGAGRGTRAAAAWARQTLLGMASTKLGVPVSALSVSKGVVSGGGKTVSYGDLIGGKLFHVTMPASYDLQHADGIFTSAGLSAGTAPAKPIANYTVVGTSPQRFDIPGIVT